MSESPSSIVVSSEDLLAMRTNLIGACMGSVMYGVNFTIYSGIVYLYCKQRRPITGSAVLMFAWSTVIFLGATGITALGIKLSQLILVDSLVDVALPKGSVQSIDPTVGINRYNIALLAVYTATNFFADLLVLYRLWIVYLTKWVMLLPTLTFVAWFGCAVAEQYYSANLPTSTRTIKLVGAYFGLSAGVSLLCTVFIVARLFWWQRQLKKHNLTDKKDPYISIAAMIVESAALYAATSVLFLGFVLSDSATAVAGGNVLNPMVGQIMCIAPNLIMLRVAAGRAYTPASVQRMSHSIEFERGPGQESTSRYEWENSTTQAGSNSTLAKEGKR